MEKSKIKVGFVCFGNACRSIMAEAILGKMSDKYTVFSAGLHPLGRVPLEVRSVLENHGFNTVRLYSKGLNDIPLDEINFLVVLDTYVAISRELVALLELSSLQMLTWDVSDPYGGLDSDYLETFNFLSNRMKSFVKEIDIQMGEACL